MIREFTSISDLPDYDETKALTAEGNICIVKKYFSSSTMATIERKINGMMFGSETWMPLDDNCIDYRRINDEYPESFVKARTHSFLIHFFNGMNKELLEATMDLWKLKLAWAGITKYADIKSKLNCKPSDGYIPRVVSHLYPSGGGYLAPHTDPFNPSNPIQTLVVGSKKGDNFQSGGLFVNVNGKDICIDEFCDRGDVVIFDQSFTHEVRPVDPEKSVDWHSLNGRLQHVFLFARSDYLKGKVADVESK